ncbi:MAG TPA: hypothetical protein VKU02_19055 [Gemmataceae bacterium]|nr:hypothetical protein [Gemmataceae bacterium]
MKRCLLSVAVLAAMVTVSGLALQQSPTLLLITWASNAPPEMPVAAVLIEMGLNDPKPRDWSGQATVVGATVTTRDGYRFRTGDEFVQPNGWKAASHRGIRAPQGNPAVNKMEPVATVGVVLHLQDISPDAELTVDFADKEVGKENVPLKDVLAGQIHKLKGGNVVIRLISTAAAVAEGRTEDDFPAAAYAPDGSLWVAWVSYFVKDEQRRTEAPSLKEQPKDFHAYDTPGFGDQLYVKRYHAGKWGPPMAVTGPGQDVARCAVVSGKDKVWVIYSAQRGGNFDLYCRVVAETAEKDKAFVFRRGPEQRITTQPGPDINPVACTDQDKIPWLACQTWIDGQGRISVFRMDDRGSWKQRALLEGGKGENCWNPAIAADNTGNVAVAYDCYHDGDYDIQVAVFEGKSGNHRVFPVATTRKSETRPSIAYQGERWWIAYEEGPEKWGKDSGALALGKGSPLYSDRSVRLVSLDSDGKCYRPAAELPLSHVKNPGAQFRPDWTQQYEKATRYAYPKLGVDLKGRLWVTYRQSFSSRYSSIPGSYWLTLARRLDQKEWSEAIELHHSDGLLDHRPVLLPHKSGGLLVIHNTDGRYTTPEKIANHVYAGVINLPGGDGPPEQVASAVTPKPFSTEAAAEREAVRRIRDYRIDHGGKTYRILRGEFHRHTEISWDGGADGSLEDMFRYGIDAANLDWIGNGDHDNGAGREYPWWLVQKLTDAFHVPGAFTPMFSYERSVSYPHGHRNCMFARRGIRTLPRLAPPEGEKSPGGVHPDDTKMLYRYLKELDGVCASHTSATGMGTDWRDNDPAVEPVVEIYQGDRMSYEMEGAPRAGYDPKSGKEPANIAGWYPKGYINLALGKGYRLGFQSSSDHWSTHISFFMVLAERPDRASILDAIKRRHTYGATDNILVDLRSGPHIQGDEFQTRSAPVLSMLVRGTADLDKIDVLKDSQVVATLQPQGSRYEGTWTDPRPESGTHYYYIRVLQKDGEIAWASPMWIEFKN